MRILITTDTIGGVWNYAMDLTFGLLREDSQVDLVSLGPEPDKYQRDLIRKCQYVYPVSFTFTSLNYPLEWMPGECRLVESAVALEQLIASLHPDILHFNQYSYGSISTNLPKLVVAHSDVVSWWYACLGTAPPTGKWIEGYRKAVSSGLALADCVVAPTAWQMHQLQKHYALVATPHVVIPNAANTQTIPALRRLQAVSAGRVWDQAKNVSILERAALDIPVYVAGSTKLQCQSGQPVPLASTLQMLGQIGHTALQQLFAESEVYIAPSLYEPFGLAPLEAAQQGCALLLSDIDTFREVWQEDAIYFSPMDPESLRLQIASLVADPAFLVQMGARAKCRAQKLYSFDSFISKYLSLYKQMLSVEGCRNAA